MPFIKKRYVFSRQLPSGVETDGECRDFLFKRKCKGSREIGRSLRHPQLAFFSLLFRCIQSPTAVRILIKDLHPYLEKPSKIRPVVNLQSCVMGSCLFGTESPLRLLACHGRTAILLRQGRNLRGPTGTHQQGAIPQAPEHLPFDY